MATDRAFDHQCSVEVLVEIEVKMQELVHMCSFLKYRQAAATLQCRQRHPGCPDLTRMVPSARCPPLSMTGILSMPSVSATLIVRNEAARLARCLESVSAHVDEIVVVDTGSTDDTVAIASRFGCRIGHFAWNDDFSAARNAALSLSCTDWNFVIDADEWLVDPATLREAVRHVPDSTGLVCVRSECVLEGCGRMPTAGFRGCCLQRSAIRDGYTNTPPRTCRISVPGSC